MADVREMTKEKIEKLAREIRKFLDDNFLNGDCRIYFNGMCLERRSGWKVIEDISPKDYFEWADGIICMSFEGRLYDFLNGWSYSNFKKRGEFYELLKKHGCYYELGDTWNLSVYEN